MFEWRSLRTAAVVLLCLPLLHLAWIVTRDFASYLNPSPEAWRDNIEAIIENDREITIPELPILAIGGQRVTLWKDLPELLRPRQVLMRPLGDATLDDLIHYYDRLVAYYRPNILLLVPGYADLHLRDEKTPDEFARALSTFLEKDNSYGHTYWRYVFAPLQMPLHPEDKERIEAMVSATLNICERLPRTSCIDANPLLTDATGRPNPDYYRGDGVNLNDVGYARVSMLTQERLREDGALQLTIVTGD